MKKSLREELERIHTITYGKRVVTEENIIDKIFKTIGIDRDKLPKIDEPKSMAAANKSTRDNVVNFMVIEKLNDC